MHQGGFWVDEIYGYASLPRAVDASGRQSAWSQKRMLNQISAPFQRDDGIQDRAQQSGVMVATKITPKCWSRENSESRCLLLTTPNKCMLSAIELQDQCVPCVCCLCNVPENKHSMIPCICQCGRRRLLVHHPARSYAIVFSVLFGIGSPLWDLFWLETAWWFHPKHPLGDHRDHLTVGTKSSWIVGDQMMTGHFIR